MARRREVVVIPEAVVAWRHKRGMTQLQLSVAADCSEALIAHVERGSRNLSRATLDRVALALMVPSEAIGNEAAA